MAEVLLGAVVESITGNLLFLLSEKTAGPFRVEARIEALVEKLRRTDVVLREVEKRRVVSEDVKNWLRTLGDVLRDADDLLDDFSTEVFRRRVMGGDKRIQYLYEVRTFFSSSNQLIYAYKMIRRVKDIRERIDAILNDVIRFEIEADNNLIGSLGLVERRVRPRTHGFESEDQYVIGREKDKKEVIEFLLNPDFEENVSILPIVGIGGLGKTTLARLVFNDESVKEYFELKIWVCVSIDFDVEDILRAIVRECTPNEDLSKLNMSEVRERLGEELDGKKFLVVLDDLWNDNRDKWLNLHRYLVNGAKGSKILLTTRSLGVARTMTSLCRELSSLSEDESLSLLMRMAMKQEHEWRNQNLEMIAKEILKKCAGVPLAIITIGRLLLFTRNTEEDWLKLKNKDLSIINQEDEDIIQSLKLSYYLLPSHLRKCFSYCSLFPKDYRLRPHELIRLWRAQGLIKPLSNEQTIEEVGLQYFMELASRSFFQDVEEDQYGYIVRCKMHVLMHDLAQSVAGNDFATIDSSHVKTVPEGARHVSVVATEDYEWNGFARDETVRTVRSLLLIVEKRIEISHLDVSGFTNLRALHLQGVVWDVTGESIGELKHLRSLDLSKNDNLSYLPDSISNLRDLETLNLRGCRSLQYLPRGITKLVNLRQLDVSGCSRLTHMPRGISKLSSLQLLGMFVVGEKRKPDAARFVELSRLTRLRKELSIQNLERLGSISSKEGASLMEKFVLQYLGLHWESNVVAANNAEEVLERLRPHPDLKGLRIEGYGGTELSSWFSQLHKLVTIEIIDCNICRHLPSLDQLRFLERISLSYLSSLECIGPLDQLPSLESISLSYLSNLECIELSNSGMPESFYPFLKEIELKHLDEFRGWERRRGDRNRIKQKEEGEEEEEAAAAAKEEVPEPDTEEVEEDDDSSSLCMIQTSSDKVKISINNCPRFSYMLGQQLQLSGATINLQKLFRPVTVRHTPIALTPSLEIMMMTSISLISLSTSTSITIESMVDAEHLPVELFRSTPSLRSLIIKRCPRLKYLPVRRILRYLAALEALEISDCGLLDLSIEDGDDCDEGRHGQHSKLRCLHIRGIHKMESLPWWFQYLSNLQELRITLCLGLKSLPGRLILQLSTTLKSLEIHSCPELDLAGHESEDQEDMPNLQSYGPTKPQKLEFSDIRKMKTKPWWIQHLTNLEKFNISCLPQSEGFA
ncbi:putative disease resistance protein RGA3 [Punica granatum]|uniref:Disease resistance protein RGA3 n=1 Tax=Punica granatum TaxID=22663 RepID=A0A6P8BVI8_PUNGR|nr:putative disease resistance protein RGA3 [Punica granatum]XP_031374310.1 putative disease resistance protein RGA3 [Punica granatum]XP_031374311.1 putative disease resistance protein RGA3 [Punica granatum]XP_031374313.1 putative disease resistance protein RGA3 [Punica granatum]XP_031374314.1 putative disease resistance protein RGA3 [Punica granatum]XP_031374315.1 putative disease resistance protein RGA3 [Punica granatum]XP_031374316.1 putative disease resistance protein RGA3 [Punica granatu